MVMVLIEEVFSVLLVHVVVEISSSKFWCTKSVYYNNNVKLECNVDTVFYCLSRKLVTCGTDGDIRVWSGFEDVDPVQTCVGEWALCVRQKGCLLFVATDNNDVQKMTFPDAERDGLLVRFTCHVTHMALTKAHDVRTNDYLMVSNGFV